MELEKLELNRKKDALSKDEIKYFDTLSDSEITEYIEYCTKQYNYYNAMQNGLKLILNSTYGAFGNPFFVCSTNDIAGAITAMGRDTIKFTDTINETYWYDFWHIDTELHEILGLDTTKIKHINPIWIHRLSGVEQDIDFVPTQEHIFDGEYRRKCPVSCYVDTDSLFVGFEYVIDQIGIESGKEQEFINNICKHRLEPLFKTKLNSYAKKFNVKNIHDFELENINESVLFLAKKCYIKHTIWEDGTQYERLKNLVAKGVGLVKKGTPKFARENIYKIINYIFDNAKTYNIKDMLKFVRELKKEFELTDIADIVQGCNVNAYYSSKIVVDGQMIDGPGVVEDKTDLKFGKTTYFTIKAAGLYNYLLNQHPELKNTYDYIRPGTKCKIYPCIHDKNDKFCYPVGAYPKEFAPPIDMDELFSSTILKQVNIYVKALGLNELNSRLRVVLSLF